MLIFSKLLPATDTKLSIFQYFEYFQIAIFLIFLILLPATDVNMEGGHDEAT